MDKFYVYIMKIHPSGHYYYGQTGRLTTRFQRHRRELEHGKHHNANAQKVYDENPDSFVTFESVALPSKEEAVRVEEEMIASGLGDPLMLNIAIGGKSTDTHSRHPKKEELSKVKSENAKRIWANKTPEERERCSERSRGKNNGMYGKTHTPEVRKILSEVNKGRPSPRKGTKMTEEQKVNIYAYVSNRDYSGEKNPFLRKDSYRRDSKEVIREENGQDQPNVEKSSIDKRNDLPVGHHCGRGTQHERQYRVMEM